MLDVATQEGMNEKGLSARTLYLAASVYGLRDETRPGLCLSIWAQYILDNFASVAAAVQSLTAMNVQIVPIGQPANVPKALLHLAIEDASGDSAIIEMINGQMQVYHDRKYTVMTNDPPYNIQSQNMAKAVPPLPGGLGSEDRFIRAYYYSSLLIQPADRYKAVSEMFSVLANISVPFAAITDGLPTWWRTVMDLTNRVYFFNSTLKPNVVWVNMSRLNLAAGAPEREFDVEWGPDASGDITDLLQIAEKFVFKDYTDYDPKNYYPNNIYYSGVGPATNLLLHE